MKKLLTLLCTGVIGVLLFVSPGSTIKAAADCGCNVTPILGVEKNKMVSDLLKSDVFKTAKQGLMQEGYTYNGVSNIEVIEVIKVNGDETIIIGVPFINENGTVEMAAFINGFYMGHTPADE